LFDKTASENWPVLWHQDLTIAVIEEKAATGYSIWSHKDGSPHVQPPVELLENMVTIRLHLDDATAANGALRVIPGSHCNGKISPNDIKSYHKEDVTTCECLTGDVLLMSPLLLHSSQRSENPFYVYPNIVLDRFYNCYFRFYLLLHYTTVFYYLEVFHFSS